MSLRRLLTCLSALLSVSLLLSVAAHAGIGFQPVSPDELRMTSEPLAPGAPAIILFRQVDRDDTGNTAHEDNYFRIKILTEEGRKHADIEIPFFKENGNNIVNIHARTIRPDGSIANFDGKVFEKSIAKAQGLKYIAKTFTLPDVQVGSIIEYYYTLDLSENVVYESHWTLNDELFTKHAKFSLKPYTLTDSGVSMRWTWDHLPAGTGQPKEGPDHIVRLEVSNVPAFQTEDFMPPEYELQAHVDFTYTRGTFDTKPDQFWKNVAKKRNDSLEGFIGKKGAMEQAVGQIVSPSDSPEVKLQKIYARVQQIRNTSFEVQKSEQEKKREKEKEPSNVEEMWKRGYGDGEHITWLFLALARAAGFEAYGVWVSERRNYFFQPSSMDERKLDENVALVKVNGKDMYFDPGSAFTPYGILPWSETGVQGLRLDKNGGTWIETTIPDSSVSRIEHHAELALSPSTGDLEGKLTITFVGLEAQRRRVEERHEDETARKKFLEDEAKQYIPAACDVVLKNKPDWGSSSPTLLAEYDLKIPGWAAGAGRRVLLPVGLFSATEKHVFDHAERVHPIYFQFPFQKLEDVSITLPEGWQVSSVPPAENQDLKAVAYLLQAENGKQAVHMTRKLRVDLMLVDTKFYSTLRDFFQTVRKDDEQQIVLQPGGAGASK